MKRNCPYRGTTLRLPSEVSLLAARSSFRRQSTWVFQTKLDNGGLVWADAFMAAEFAFDGSGDVSSTDNVGTYFYREA